jgi:ABC-type lipopolysaccharide export system ATPase subunit
MKKHKKIFIYLPGPFVDISPIPLQKVQIRLSCLALDDNGIFISDINCSISFVFDGRITVFNVKLGSHRFHRISFHRLSPFD